MRDNKSRKPILIIPGVIAMGLAVSLFSSCYLLRQGAALVGDQFRAEPIERLVTERVYRNGDALSEQTVGFLDAVGEIRAFASGELGLAVGRNYTTFVHTDRETLAYVVNATDELSFERTYWSWPFAGRFPYKGYFREPEAVRLVERLQRGGHDVWLRRVDAFSTLGILSDPLYEFMQSYDLYQLANMIIHEQTHATLFLRNQIQFNEELATFVGDLGARAFMESVGATPETIAEIDRLEHDRDLLRSLVAQLRGELEAVYQSDLSDEEKRAEKARAIRSALARYEAHYDQLFLTDRFRGLSDLRVNNAFIDLFSAYTQDLSLFEELYRASGSDLATMIESLSILGSPRRIADRELRSLARRDPKEYIRVVLLDGAADDR
jgi:predicted aminopeptidase